MQFAVLTNAKQSSVISKGLKGYIHKQYDSQMNCQKSHTENCYVNEVKYILRNVKFCHKWINKLFPASNTV